MAQKLQFLSSWPARLLTALLLAQGLLVGILAPAEKIPPSRPLSEIPRSIDGWTMFAESPLEPEVQQLLKADDTLNRSYLDPERASYAHLFIAFFRSQRAGVAPHSPKVCLPGSGWVPTESNNMNIQIPGRPDPIQVNRYIVARGEDRSLVIYWYQTPYRVIAGEFSAKLYTMVDGLRHHRSDTSLVRVIVPIQGDEKQAEAIAVRFIRHFFNPVRAFLPA